MPKLKADEVDIDVSELEGAEYSEDEFEDYAGEIPKAGTVLVAYVKKMWYTYTQPKPDRPEGDPMLKALLIAADNTGRLAQYNGLPVWENMALTAGSKWKWAPFLRTFGLTIKDVKTKTYVEDDDDPRNGAPIIKISNWQVGEDHDEAWCRIIIKRGKTQDGEPRAEIRKVLEYEEPEPDEPDDEPDDAEEVVEDVDADGPFADDEPNEEDDEPNEEAEQGGGRRGGRGRAAPTRTAGKASATRSGAGTTAGRTRSASATRAAGSTRTAKAATAPAGRGRGRRAAGSADDPPF